MVSVCAVKAGETAFSTAIERVAQRCIVRIELIQRLRPGVVHVCSKAGCKTTAQTCLTRVVIAAGAEFVERTAGVDMPEYAGVTLFFNPRITSSVFILYGIPSKKEVGSRKRYGR